MFVRTLAKSVFLLFSLVVIVCGIYPFALWLVGQTFFSFQANGSRIYDEKNQLIGSKLIAQSFTKEEYFQPRPSAAAYDASASASSSLAVSNYALRDRVARALGPVVKNQNGQFIGKDMAKWAKAHPELVKQFMHANFFDMWRQDHPDVILQNVPGDFVTTSASGLDPHITLQNAEFQLPRVAAKWASDLKRNPADIQAEIEKIIQEKTEAPLYGLVGEKIVNVLELNLELRKRYKI